MAEPKIISPELVLRQLLRDRPDDVVETALAARRVVLKLAGDCCEMIYEVYCISDAFSYTGRLGQSFLHIATYSQHVNIGFSLGTELDDPIGLLKGSGKRIRHIRLDNPSTAGKAEVKRLISAAVAQGREMAKKSFGIVKPCVTVQRKGKSSRQ